jgi:hypothetical protein
MVQSCKYINYIFLNYAIKISGKNKIYFNDKNDFLFFSIFNIYRYQKKDLFIESCAIMLNKFIKSCDRQ